MIRTEISDSQVPYVIYWRDLECGSFNVINNGTVQYIITTYYWLAIVSIALFCTIFKLLDIE